MLKKKLLSLLMAAVICLSFSAVPAAAATKENISVYPNAATIFVDGQKVDGQSFSYNNTTYIPLRGVVEKMGGNVEWNNTSKTATISSKANPEALGLDEMLQANMLAYMMMSECMNDLYLVALQIYSAIYGGTLADNLSMTGAMTGSLQDLNELSLPTSYPGLVSALKNDELTQMTDKYNTYKELLNKIGNASMKYNLQPELLGKYVEPISEVLASIRADYNTCVARSFNFIEVE